MIMDKLTTFCDATALNTGAAGTYNIGDVIDLEQVRDIGQGNPLYLVISVAVTATSAGSATGQFRLVSDSVATPDTSTATVHATSAAHAKANMSAGDVLFVIALPMEGSVYERYLGIQQVTGVAAFTAGAINAFLTPTPQAWKSYADGQN